VAVIDNSCEHKDTKKPFLFWEGLGLLSERFYSTVAIKHSRFPKGSSSLTLSGFAVYYYSYIGNSNPKK
jgi:hypothetical protein